MFGNFIISNQLSKEGFLRRFLVSSVSSAFLQKKKRNYTCAYIGFHVDITCMCKKLKTYDNFLNFSSTELSSLEVLLRKLCFSDDGLLDVPLKMIEYNHIN